VTRQRALQTILGLAISAGCLWLVLRDVPLAEVIPALRQAHFWWLAPALIALAVDVIIRAVRWGVLLRPIATISWKRLLSPTIIGYMGNALLPARLGEVLRATLLGRVLQVAGPDGSRLSDSTSAAFGSIALERTLDGLATVAILAVTAWLVPHPDWLTKGLDAVTALCVTLLVVLVALVASRPIVIPMLHRWFGHLPWAARPLRWTDHLLSGLEALRDPRLMIRALVLTIAIWGVSALEFYWVIRAFDLPLNILQAAFLMVGVGLATVIPSAPAALGTFELASMALLAMLGIEKAAAFSFTIVMHLMWSFPLLIAGLILLWWTGYSGLKPKSGPDRPA
jgi:uncharacterized membrane protein YbhN (UPF0104 family)